MLYDRLDGEERIHQAQQQRVVDSRRRLEQYLSTTPHDESEIILAQRANEYLAAVRDFETARQQGDEITLCARRLYRCDAELQDALYRTVRGLGTRQPSRTKRILVAIKDQDSSDRVLYSAIHLAENLGARLKLLHVIPEPSPKNGHPSDIAADAQSAADMLGRKQVEVPSDIASEVLVRRGDPATEIVSAARRWAADFIVMGIHGCGRANPHLTADHVQNVLPLASCPVIIVGQPPSKTLAANALLSRSQSALAMN
jgi:nucleotide-binding universal stress UspA family protein